MTSTRTGKPIANQFIIDYGAGNGANGNYISKKVFQSYKSTIAVIIDWEDSRCVELDADTWNYSKTTSKYRSEFLGENTKTTKAKIASGEYKLTNLN